MVAPRKGIQDSLGFWIPGCGFRIPGTGVQSLSVDYGFWIPILSGIPDSFSCILDSKAQDSRFHKHKFHRFRNPDFLTWGDEECSFCVAKEYKSWSNFHHKLIWETTFPTFTSFPVTRKSILASTDVRSIIVGASCIDVTERDRRSTFVDI